MSLEVQIEQLNTNITKLISVLTTPDRLAAAASADAVATLPVKPAKAPKSAPAAASVAATSPTQTAAPTPQPAAPLTPAPVSTAAPTIEAARALVIELGQKKGREAVMALLTKFGASKLPEVPPHLYGAVIEGASAALAE